MSKRYDFLIVGTGLFGAVSAYLLKRKGFSVFLIDKRDHIGGNVYTKNVRGVNVHQYGAHIFHTSNKAVWDFVNSFVEFNRYTNSPVANYKGKLYNLPFNMNTFYQMWGVKTPEEAKAKIEEQKKEYHIENPKNLEEQAISLIGKDIYEALIKGYTQKQWGRQCTELPAFIIKRLPVRFTFDNNYFNDKYQGIPEGGYTALIEKMLEGCEVRLGLDYFDQKDELDALGKAVELYQHMNVISTIGMVIFNTVPCLLRQNCWRVWRTIKAMPWSTTPMQKLLTRVSLNTNTLRCLVQHSLNVLTPSSPVNTARNGNPVTNLTTLSMMTRTQNSMPNIRHWLMLRIRSSLVVAWQSISITTCTK